MTEQYTVRDYIDALREAANTPFRREMLAAHYQAPDHTLTATQMSEALGWGEAAAEGGSYGRANLHYGGLARRISESLGCSVPGGKWLYVLSTFEKREGRWHWIMRPSVAAALERLGWTGGGQRRPRGVEESAGRLREGKMPIFSPGQVYTRRDLHQAYGGQRQGGISTPTGRPLIMLFTGSEGHQYGYSDDWIEDGLFLYTGEGQQGDMTLARGNLAVIEHATDGKDLHLFESMGGGRVRYVGQMVCTGQQEREVPDKDGNPRRAILFELTPLSTLGPESGEDPTGRRDQWSLPLATLRERALAAGGLARTPHERRQQIRERSEAVRVYVLRRAAGVCEACAEKAPFRTAVGRPYLEPHHTRRLTDGGPDHPAWVAGVCPNCHRRAHYGEDGSVFNERLKTAIREKEPDE